MIDYTGHGLETGSHLPTHYPYDWTATEDGGGVPFWFRRPNPTPLPHLPIRRRMDGTTTQPVATSPTGNDGGNSNTSAPTQFTPEQWQAIQDAVNSAFANIAHGESIGQIDSLISQALISSGLFTAQEIDVVLRGAKSSDSHGDSFVEQANPQGYKGGDGGAALKSTWLSHIQSAVLSWLSTNTPPAPTSGNTGTNPGDQNNLGSLIGALTSQNPGGGPTSDTTGLGNGVPTVMPTSSTATSPIVLLLLLAAAGLAYWWWSKKHHAESSGD